MIYGHNFDPAEWTLNNNANAVRTIEARANTYGGMVLETTFPSWPDGNAGFRYWRKHGQHLNMEMLALMKASHCGPRNEAAFTGIALGDWGTANVGNVRRAADGAWVGTSAINGRIVSQRNSEEAAMSDVAQYWVKARERARLKRRRNA